MVVKHGDLPGFNFFFLNILSPSNKSKFLDVFLAEVFLVGKNKGVIFHSRHALVYREGNSLQIGCQTCIMHIIP